MYPVRYMLRPKKQLSIELTIQYNIEQPDGSTAVDEIDSWFSVRI
jgi:hypothetical protein